MSVGDTGSIPGSIPGTMPGTIPTGAQSDFSYADLQQKVHSFFDSYLCNKESGLSPTTCNGASMWAGGAKTILDVASGMFGMTYGIAQIAYGIGVEIPCNLINKITGGRLEGVGSLLGLGISSLGTLSAGAMWVATRPWHALDLLIGATISTIDVLHKTSLVGGGSSFIPRISPLHLILGTILFFSITRGTSEPTYKSTIQDECRQAQARARFEKNVDKINKNRKFFA